MKCTRQGWTMLFFLIVISIIMLLATNGFKSSSMMMASARMRYRHHQELRLIEGLLTYGIQLCNENKIVLISWGVHKSQTMSLSFDPWPSDSGAAVFGQYSGLLSITSQEGSIYLDATMTKNNKPIMIGQCVMRMRDPKDLQSDLVVSNWCTHVSG